jgi:hypothetical protein
MLVSMSSGARIKVGSTEILVVICYLSLARMPV